MLYAGEASLSRRSELKGSREYDGIHRDCLRSSRPHGIVKEDRDSASTNTTHTRQPWHDRSSSKQLPRGRYTPMTQLLHLGGIIHENVDLSLEIDRQIRSITRACLTRFGPELYDRTTAPLSLKVRMLKPEVIETLLDGCVTWTLRAEHFAKLETAPTKSRCGSLASSAEFVVTTPPSRTRRPSR